ncbi:pilus assembly PilX N-terminal domain-containing protein [Lacisediminimonas sp.]|uniref:pilus assembly PilX family protein n=1 Tax=Lacisediminimonas sp. TaxID=3060582 RepID=UPI002718CAE7|nr:pilus assembly PilX N-terminal domain-containing protein [Lacisediminimonas sp.]MDO8298338.1 pilus assembly PilX N-terminal domain-containing protein [Lacisediminimonas sp.]MDO9217577.1 pilus assembly PilX N-terminal domain-containing protein [Lacisediminimonas sp.]
MMKRAARQRLGRQNQRGATLIVGLIMLAVITLLVSSAFNMSTTNLKAVGNMQRRAEALAAANKAIEQVISSPFTGTPTADQINVDINNDGTNDYVVTIATPTCIAASRTTQAAGSGTASSLSLGLPAAVIFYNTVWDIDATVSDVAGSSAAVRVRQGVRVLLSETQYGTVCT